MKQYIEGIRYTKHRGGNIRQKRNKMPKAKRRWNANQTRDKIQNTEGVRMQEKDGIRCTRHRGRLNTCQRADEM